MANCFTRKSNFPRYLSKKDYHWFPQEFYHEGGINLRYGPDHVREKIVRITLENIFVLTVRAMGIKLDFVAAICSLLPK